MSIDYKRINPSENTFDELNLNVEQRNIGNRGNVVLVYLPGNESPYITLQQYTASADSPRLGYMILQSAENVEIELKANHPSVPLARKREGIMDILNNIWGQQFSYIIRQTEVSHLHHIYHMTVVKPLKYLEKLHRGKARHVRNLEFQILRNQAQLANIENWDSVLQSLNIAQNQIEDTYFAELSAQLKIDTSGWFDSKIHVAMIPEQEGYRFIVLSKQTVLSEDDAIYLDESRWRAYEIHRQNLMNPYRAGFAGLEES